MALKKVLKSLDGLSDVVKAEYKQVGDEFHLDVEGDDSAQQIEHWKGKHRIAEEHREKAEKKNKELEDNRDNMLRGAIPKADVEALEGSWREKVTKAETERDEARKAHDTEVAGLTVGATADQVARELFTVPGVMKEVVRKRLTTEVVDGVRQVRVKDASGKPSAMTLDELKAELKANPEYAGVVIAGKGSGGNSGGNGNGGNGGAGGGNKKFHELSETERIEFAKRDPDGFRAAMGR